MAYYIKYNDVDLTNMIKVREVNTTLTPPRENSTIDIWERAGEIYNGYRWESREITISFLLMYTEEEYDNNPLILQEGLDDIKNLLNVEEPKELYLNTPDRFIYAIPDGEISVSELRYNCAEIEVKFICYNPFYYNEQAKQYNGIRKITVENEGDVPTDPVIVVGITSSCHFVQVENLTNKKKMLIGTFPKVSKPSADELKNILTDECNDTTGWTLNTSAIASDRTTGGTLATTEKGTGIMCGNFGSAGNTSWHGVSARKNLGTNITNFEVEAWITNTATGVNGDPNKVVDLSKPETKYSGSTVTTNSGTREEYYEVTCTALNIRAGASTSYKVVGYLKKGDKIYPSKFTGHNGLWGQIGEGKWCYCSPSYVTKKYKDSTDITVTTGGKSRNIRNFYTTSTAEIRQKPTKDSKIVCNIPSGEIVRIINEKIWEESKDSDGNVTASNNDYWYKLETAWKGHNGYIKGNNVALANNVSIEYPEEPETADDKTGIIELYGYDSNGAQLFQLSMIDDNEWYEFNYPVAKVGSKEFIKDTSTAPTPKTKTTNKVDNDKLTVTKDYLLSGKYGDWNDFRGKIGIKRVNGVWQAWFIKMQSGKVVKQMFSPSRKVTGSPTGNLSYITIYIGTNSDKPTGMSFEKIEVKNLTPVDTTTKNARKFLAGDVLKIDCFNNRVWLNDKLYNNVEIGSQFFQLETGTNIIKLTSDKDPTTTVIFNEKYL